MRILIIFISLILLVSCTTTNYYDQTVKSWRGSHSNELITRWGKPNQIIKLPDGTAYYIYTIDTSNAFPAQTTETKVWVVNRQGQTIGAEVPVDRPTPYPMACTTTFAANKQGIIIQGSSDGFNCESVVYQHPAYSPK